MAGAPLSPEATQRQQDLTADGNRDSQAHMVTLNRLLARQKLVEAGYVANVTKHFKKFEEEAAGRLASANAQRGAAAEAELAGDRGKLARARRKLNTIITSNERAQDRAGEELKAKVEEANKQLQNSLFDEHIGVMTTFCSQSTPWAELFECPYT
eukprot:SAG11_NODE_7440_length_1143_cov_1.622605_1_plen_155_part_00